VASKDSVGLTVALELDGAITQLPMSAQQKMTVMKKTSVLGHAIGMVHLLHPYPNLLQLMPFQLFPLITDVAFQGHAGHIVAMVLVGVTIQMRASVTIRVIVTRMMSASALATISETNVFNYRRIKGLTKSAYEK